MVAIRVAPPPLHRRDPQKSIVACEGQLAEWFERPVVLTSSGRAALLLCFQELGLNRYRSRLAMPPRTAQCVFDAVTRTAFPVDIASDRGDVDATLLIHQYGHLLHDRPDSPVIEDICHAFFSHALGGARNWAGELAVFSLPKFFPMGGMAGGIVAADETLATAMRQRRDAAPKLDAPQMARDHHNWVNASGPRLEEITLRALLHPQPAAGSFAGLPDDPATEGRRRQEVTEAVLAMIPENCLDAEWRSMCLRSLPFAIPLFASFDSLTGLMHILRQSDIEADIYRIDAARSMAAPDPKPAILLPCHQYIGTAELQKLANAIENWSQNSAPTDGSRA